MFSHQQVDGDTRYTKNLTDTDHPSQDVSPYRVLVISILRGFKVHERENEDKLKIQSREIVTFKKYA